MNKTKCIIVDDEPLSRDVLKTYISDHEALELVGECVDAMEAGNFLRSREDVGLIFLDINMPKISGVSFYRGLSTRPDVIFTTAYPNYAVEGFELNAVDYLVKPFGFDRFYSAVEKALTRQSQDLPAPSFITVKVDKRLFRVETDTIRYIESIGDYAKIHLPNRVLISSETLKGYEKLLPDHQFVRIHKSYIISIDFVDYLEGNQISIGGVKLPVGKAYRESLKRKFV